MYRNLASNLSLFLGITGAILLSLDVEFRNFGYLPFLASAIFGCIALYRVNVQLFILNIGYGLINLNGIISFLL